MTNGNTRICLDGRLAKPRPIIAEDLRRLDSRPPPAEPDRRPRMNARDLALCKLDAAFQSHFILWKPMDAPGDDHQRLQVQKDLANFFHFPFHSSTSQRRRMGKFEPPAVFTRKKWKKNEREPTQKPTNQPAIS